MGARNPGVATLLRELQVLLNEQGGRFCSLTRFVKVLHGSN